MVGVVQHVFSNNVANATGTITIWNISGIQATIAATNVVRPQDWNSTHNQSVTLSGNTAFGNTSVVGGTNIVLSASNGIMFSGDSANSSVGIGLAQYASAWEFPGGSAQGQGAITTIAPSTSSLLLYPWYPIPNVSWSAVGLPVSMFSSVSAGASSASGAITFTFGLYSLSSTALSSMTTNTCLVKYSGTSTAQSWTISNGVSSTVYSSTSMAARFNGPVSLYLPWASSVSGGGTYFVGFIMAVAGTTASSASANFAISFYGASIASGTASATNTTSSGFGIGAASWGRIDTSTAFAAALGYSDRFNPVVYSAQTGALPASIPIGGTQTALNWVPQFPFMVLVNS